MIMNEDTANSDRNPEFPSEFSFDCIGKQPLGKKFTSIFICMQSFMYNKYEFALKVGENWLKIWS